MCVRIPSNDGASHGLVLADWAVCEDDLVGLDVEEDPVDPHQLALHHHLVVLAPLLNLHQRRLWKGEGHHSVVRPGGDNYLLLLSVIFTTYLLLHHFHGKVLSKESGLLLRTLPKM